ncbi:MAG: PEP-utilizing enzyme [Alphaproteobacteria bacterium]|nr:PEP-utilizing enzyme [Alphaproteobacteria bacterium]
MITWNSNGKVGGKGAALFRLTDMGLPVPEFFVVSTDAMAAFIKENDIRAGDSKAIMRGKLSPELEKEITAAAAALGGGKFSVRSSATMEDGAEKSFAGQFSSFLNVDKKGLPAAIKKVWASLFSGGAAAYAGRGFDSHSMAVIVQKMVKPYAAGVAFSINPMAADKNYMLIESCAGTGDKLVSGKITPSKYFVRRSSKKTDAVYGRRHISESSLKKLASFVLEIEQEFGTPTDVEWCASASGKIHILQARPITSFAPAPIEYRKLFSRPHSIMKLQLYRHAEDDGLRALTNGDYHYTPLFTYDAARDTVDVHYNFNAPEQHPANILREMDCRYAWTANKYRAAEKAVPAVLEYISGKRKFEAEKFLGLLRMVYTLSNLGNVSEYTKSKRMRRLAAGFRKKYDYVAYRAEDFLIEKAAEVAAPELRDDLRFLTFEEVFGGRRVSRREIDVRKKGFVYFGGELTCAASLKPVLEKNNFFIAEEAPKHGALRGQSICRGVATGVVRIIYGPKDFGKFRAGDIIVAPMTLPSFTPLMKIAAAIITDEGGATCHAAIVARELKVPCIIGVKNATSVLADGEKIRVDANTGAISYER